MIRIFPASQEMIMIVAEFGRFRYNCLPVGMRTFVNTFQEKLDEIIGYIEGVKTYIDDIEVLLKERLSKRKYQIIVIFSRLSAAGLKLNVPKCSFGLK